ncbi:MAG TPA: amidohydrolase family protein [Methylocella sp.]|jgi:predicted TIM-barrel fold metal-dependent hydrolase|nr:amidohydrolase family protein [Methylocella sp.]
MGLRLGLGYRGQNLGSFSNCSCHSRRDVLKGLGAIGATAALWPAAAAGQVASPAVRTVDVHHHLYPPHYRTETYERFAAQAGPAVAQISLRWTPEGALEKMDQAGVATAINSVSTPGVWFDDGEAGRALSRECNEYGANLMRDFPGRFGMFAAIPLPDTEGSLSEVAYALDVLKLDGVGVLSSYAGKFLGDPKFSPVFDELNRRKAVVFVHPTLCCGNPVPDLGGTILEAPMDTTRTITSLLINGTFARYLDIRFIFAHGGGVVTQVFNRIASAVERMKPEDRAIKVPKGAAYELQRQYYDLASVGFNPAAITALRKLFPISQLLYGSDEPFNSTVAINKSEQMLDFSPAELQAIQRDNASRLLPRLKT